MNNKQENTFPLFRNTSSRLYEKKSNFDDESTNGYHEYGSNSAQAWKQKGNEAFKIQKYDDAIEYYSKAIEMNPGESQYYSNRSKCYQKKKVLDKALKDAETACQLEEQNIKAHYICGCILAELGKKDATKLHKAENRLKKALRLCRTKSARQFQEEISIKLFRFKKLVWLRNQQKVIEGLQIEKQVIGKALDRHQIDQKTYQRITQRIDEQLRQEKKNRQIPDHLKCKITLMLMEDPVVSESGFSYERQVLEEHYKHNGLIEPITRKGVTAKVFPNHALKQAIQTFLMENPWAYEQQKGESYYEIQFI